MDHARENEPLTNVQSWLEGQLINQNWEIIRQCDAGFDRRVAWPRRRIRARKQARFKVGPVD